MNNEFQGGPGVPDPMKVHDDEAFLDTLELLISIGRAKTANDLMRYAERADEPWAAEHLRAHALEDLPVRLAFESLRVHLRIVAFQRKRSLLHSLAEDAMALILPVPMHVLQAFLSVPQVRMIVPDGHNLPPPLRRAGGRALASPLIVEGSRPGRIEVGSCSAIVFEAFRSARSEWSVEAAVGDVLDLRIVPPQVRLFAHLRPHANPDDLALSLNNHTINVL